MSQGANVRSVDAIRDFKVALINFAEEATVALGSTEMEIRQIRNWLLRDQLSYWQAQIKRGQERVSTTRADLFRRKLSQSNSDAISDTEQKEALRAAERQLRQAEEKVAIIKKWIPVFEHALSEYHSQSQPLGDRLSGSFAATLSLLDRMLASLDAYLAMAPPTAPVVPRLRAGDEETESTVASTPASATAVVPLEDKTAGPAGQPDSSSEDATAEYAVPHAHAPAKGAPDGDATAEYGTGTH
jgi:capsule polysaccharide export protein KpsE/RkpR